MLDFGLLALLNWVRPPTGDFTRWCWSVQPKRVLTIIFASKDASYTKNYYDSRRSVEG